MRAGSARVVPIWPRFWHGFHQVHTVLHLSAVSSHGWMGASCSQVSRFRTPLYFPAGVASVGPKCMLWIEGFSAGAHPDTRSSLQSFRDTLCPHRRTRLIRMTVFLKLDYRHLRLETLVMIDTEGFRKKDFRARRRDGSTQPSKGGKQKPRDDHGTLCHTGRPVSPAHHQQCQQSQR